MIRTPTAITLPELADLLRLHPSGLRLLRHFASPEVGILRPAGVIDGRGTKVFVEFEWLRAAIALALAKQGLMVARIREALDGADRARYGIARAFHDVREGGRVQFRILAQSDGRTFASYAPTGEPLSADGESFLVVALEIVWLPLVPPSEAR